MVQLSPSVWRADNQAWFSNPSAEHFVHIYRYERILVASLLEYVVTGLHKGETCVIIATPTVLISLQKALRRRGLDLAAALSKQEYITYDADEILNGVIDNRLVDNMQLRLRLRDMVEAATELRRSVRIYDHMAARLLETHHMAGAVEVEHYWSDLQEQARFSLFCAYPETLFEAAAIEAQPYRSILNLHNSCLCL